MIPDPRRLGRARGRMAELGVDVLLLSVGPDLPYFTGYEAMPLERLTMFVLPQSGDPVLLVPRLEAPRVDEHPHLFAVETWDETDDPVARVAAMTGPVARAAIGDQTWARFVLALQQALPSTQFVAAREVTASLRIVKDADEIDALRRAAQAVDHIAAAMRSEPFAGRREIDVHNELVERMLEAGHERANFAIVAAAANAASPHHEPSTRVIDDGDVVLCDFGGTMAGYCSDITRMFVVGEPASEVRDAYAVLVEAQEAGVRAAVVGEACEGVDAAARRVITDAGYGEYFVHRTGHGLGISTHEPPWIMRGENVELKVGMVHSIEPGIYLPGEFGVRLEEIVHVTDEGCERFSRLPRDLHVAEAR
jgi:Xaa-Pro aminopeptidase